MGVLQTQKPVLELEAAIRQAEHRLAAWKDRLAKAKEAHRNQIRQSLLSHDPVERQLAESIAAWWEVPLPERMVSP